MEKEIEDQVKRTLETHGFLPKQLGHSLFDDYLKQKQGKEELSKALASLQIHYRRRVMESKKLYERIALLEKRVEEGTTVAASLERMIHSG